MYTSAEVVGMIGRTSMPYMRIEDEYGSGRCDNLYFVRVLKSRVFQRILRQYF